MRDALRNAVLGVQGAVVTVEPTPVRQKRKSKEELQEEEDWDAMGKLLDADGMQCDAGGREYVQLMGVKARNLERQVTLSIYHCFEGHQWPQRGSVAYCCRCHFFH